MDSQGSIQLPQYQCHKKVWALKIAEVREPVSGGLELVPEDSKYASFTVDIAYAEKHKPVAGGYYVVYEDGYKSFSPAEAFESGYTLIQ